jgi:hypothetical protein
MAPAEWDLAQVEDWARQGGSGFVELWAHWCLFSRLVQPKTALLAQRFGNRLPVARCRVEGTEAALERLRIRYLPAMLLWQHGRIRRRWYGDTHVTEFLRALESMDAEPCKSRSLS